MNKLTPEQRDWILAEFTRTAMLTTGSKSYKALKKILTANTAEDVTSPISELTCDHTKLTEGCPCCHEWATGTPAHTEPEGEQVGSCENCNHRVFPNGCGERDCEISSLGDYCKLWKANTEPEDDTEREKKRLQLEVLRLQVEELKSHTEPEDECDCDKLYPCTKSHLNDTAEEDK